MDRNLKRTEKSNLNDNILKDASGPHGIFYNSEIYNRALLLMFDFLSTIKLKISCII